MDGQYQWCSERIVIEFKSYYSSSSGNLNTCSDGETTVCIDFGVSFKTATKALNFKISDISGILCTHGHADHCKGIPDALKKGVDCYLLPDTIERLKVSGHRVHEIIIKKLFKIGTLNIFPFPLEHDIPNCGFIIESDGGGKLVYIVDTAYCRFIFRNVNIFAVECNYSKAVLEENISSGNVPAEIRNRITRSHFELENVKEFFLANDLSAVKEIHLIHKSSNNCPDDVKEQIQAITGKEVYV